MKKLIIIGIFLSFIAVLGQTQTQTQDNVFDLRNTMTAGIKMGLNLSNVYDTKGDAFNTNPKFGYVAGGFLSIPITKYFGLQPELLFSQKGFEATGNFIGGTYNLTRTTNYFDIPILLCLKPTSQITLMAGPQYSYLLKQTDVFSNANISIVQEQQFENANIRKNIFCFLGGIDINLNHIVLGGRVGWDITDNNGDGTSTAPRYKNVWYQATLGYRFF